MLMLEQDYYYSLDSDSETMLTSSTSSTSTTDSSTTSCRSIDFKMHHHHHHRHTTTTSKNQQPAGLTIQDFRILKPIGAGDIGKVYLCQLRSNESSFYAMKVTDRDVLHLKNKTHRAETEKEILKLLDHPFLPKVIAQFDASSRFSCNVIDFCSGGDLHSLRHRQPHNRFSLPSARFYAAEVLMALEYLHMLGIVYRDLKPENILVQSDGHIMLTDFDLCLRSTSTPTIQTSSPDSADSNSSHHHNQQQQPSCSFSSPSCLPNGLFRSIKIQSLTTKNNPTFVAEPTSARSSSLVGTHEYVAPEIASGQPHGSAVDWWAFGVFLYEMLYGRTPFSSNDDSSNDATLRNIVKAPLTFPGNEMSVTESRARDLITGLLHKDATRRLGSRKGAAEIKAHAFFKGLNFALIRSTSPPEVPGLRISKSMRWEGSSGFDWF